MSRKHGLDDDDEPAASKTYRSEQAEQDGPGPILTCNLPPLCDRNPCCFTSPSAYEAHYHLRHSFSCLQCGANLPSARFLELHLSECHDPFRRIREDRGEPTYACFVEACSKLCQSSRTRMQHMIAKHGYPKEYRFNVVSRGLGDRKSLLRTSPYTPNA